MSKKFNIDLSDGLSDEFNYRLSLRLGWLVLLLIGIIFLGAYLGNRYFFSKDLTPTQRYISSVSEQYNLRRHFDGRAYGTFWDTCGVTLTADHVVSAMVDGGESFVGQPVIRNGYILDAAHYGKWSCEAPQSLTQRDSVNILGYPAGATYPALREGSIYIKRSSSGSAGYATPTWIVVFDTPEPVVGGMSGGAVLNSDDEPIGIVVVQNSPTDLDGDGQDEHSADIVALSDYYTEVLE